MTWNRNLLCELNDDDDDDEVMEIGIGTTQMGTGAIPIPTEMSFLSKTLDLQTIPG